jgi:quercetin dioxygenase-like cupin family protein
MLKAPFMKGVEPMPLRALRIIPLVVSLCLTPLLASAGDYVGAVKADRILVTGTAGNGQPHRYLRTDNPEVTALTVVIPAGAETGWHLHSVPVYAYVLSGTLVVELADGTAMTFRQGEAIVEVQNLAHNGRNGGRDDVRLAVFYTGEKGRPNVTRVPKPTSAPAISPPLSGATVSP